MTLYVIRRAAWAVLLCLIVSLLTSWSSTPSRNQNTQRTCGTFDLQRSQQFSGPIFVQDAESVSRDRQLRRRGDPAMIDPRVKLRPEPALV
jgi:hypothetical protein